MQPEMLTGGDQLIDSLKRDVSAMPSLRERERLWMQLLAEDTGPETPQAYTVSAERLDEPEPVRRQIR